MSKCNFEELFAATATQKPREALYAAIQSRISYLQVRRVRVRAALSSVVLIASIVSFVPVSLYVHQQLVESGFLQYMSLLFSDTGTVLLLWQQFALLLVDSLPALALSACASVLLVFTISLRSLLTNLPRKSRAFSSV